jgi:transcription termination/antitermination protein NusG
VSSLHVHYESIREFPPLNCAPEESNWYAVHTMSRHEKRIAGQFEEKHVRTFLPLLREVRRWSDRRSTVEVPMFSCYAFVHIEQTTEERLKVLRTPGVLGFVGTERHGTPIPKEQIESLRTAVNGKISFVPHAYIAAGSRVIVRGGSLDGVHGILVCQGGNESLVLSVELLHRSVAIRVEGYDIELV